MENKYKLEYDGSCEHLSYKYYYYKDENGDVLTVKDLMSHLYHNAPQGFGNDNFAAATEFEGGYAVVGASYYFRNGSSIDPYGCVYTWLVVNEKGDVLKEFTNKKQDKTDLNVAPLRIGNIFIGIDDMGRLVSFDADKKVETIIDDKQSSRLLTLAKEFNVRAKKRKDFYKK